MCRESAQFATVLDQLGREVLTQLHMIPAEALSLPLPFFGGSLAQLSMHFIEIGEFWAQDVVGGQHSCENPPVPLSSEELWSGLTGRFEGWLQTMHNILDDLQEGAMELPVVLPAHVREELGRERTKLRDCLLHVVVRQAAVFGSIEAICQLLIDGERTVEMVIQEHEMLS